MAHICSSISRNPAPHFVTSMKALGSAIAGICPDGHLNYSAPQKRCRIARHIRSRHAVWREEAQHQRHHNSIAQLQRSERKRLEKAGEGVVAGGRLVWQGSIIRHRSQHPDFPGVKTAGSSRSERASLIWNSSSLSSTATRRSSIRSKIAVNTSLPSNRARLRPRPICKQHQVRSCERSRSSACCADWHPSMSTPASVHASAIPAPGGLPQGPTPSTLHDEVVGQQDSGCKRIRGDAFRPRSSRRS